MEWIRAGSSPDCTGDEPGFCFEKITFVPVKDLGKECVTSGGVHGSHHGQHGSCPSQLDHYEWYAIAGISNVQHEGHRHSTTSGIHYNLNVGAGKVATSLLLGNYVRD